jgi:competence protein ComEC
MNSFERFKRSWVVFLFGILLLANCFVWYIFSTLQPTDHVTIAFLNIGQGDAIYIESPTHNQMIIDGGPPRTILGELRKVMPFYDRDIDTLLVSNPDKDHIAGFINVLENYTVHQVIEPGTLKDTDIYKKLEQDIIAEPAQRILARRGMVFDLGSGALLTILYPDKDVSDQSPNEGSIIARLTYGSTSVMFTGDAPNKTEEYELGLDGDNVRSDILKAGHHGSKTSADENFIKAVNPKWAIISAGFHNQYGHPNKETTELFNKLHVPYLITYERGTIIFTCTVKQCNYTAEK